MIAPSIKSRPVYGVLKARKGQAQVIAADSDGIQAVLRMAAAAPEGHFASAQIIYVATTKPATEDLQSLRQLAPGNFYSVADLAAALPKLAEMLSTAHMGTQLYLAGSESLIGLLMRVAVEAGLEHTSIATEHCGTLARRVQCVHCKGITEQVTTQPVVCEHCGLLLFVRDHYSRRIAAFMGVCVNAEEPDTTPPMELRFP
jgi:uncharacterized protein YfaQ (DUF2300 family)